MNDKFGSFEEYLGCRTADGSVVEKGDHRFCKRIEVDTQTCADIVRKFGRGDFMKIDIEGLDRKCLESLKTVEETVRPTFVSIENVWEYDVNLLLELGYVKFKVVNQAALQVDVSQEDEGHSGPWGDEAEDVVSGRNWRSADQVLKSLPLPESITIRGKMYKGWYDLHAGK